MKRLILVAISFLLCHICFAQDQSINGTLRVTNNLILKNDLANSVNSENYGGRITFGEGANANGDNIFVARYNIKNDNSELRFVLGNDGSEKIAIGYSYYSDGLWKERIVFKANGRIGIGVSEPTCALDANGTIRAKEVKI